MEDTKKQDNLAKECALAAAAGMSYGKWKALQPVPVVMPKSDTPPDNSEFWNTCKHCGKLFLQNGRHNRLYCGDLCKQNAANVRAREKRAALEHPLA